MAARGSVRSRPVHSGAQMAAASADAVKIPMSTMTGTMLPVVAATHAATTIGQMPVAMIAAISRTMAVRV